MATLAAPSAAAVIPAWLLSSIVPRMPVSANASTAARTSDPTVMKRRASTSDVPRSSYGRAAQSRRRVMSAPAVR